MSVLGWQPLACECGSQDFSAVHSLQWHQSQGQSSKQSGWLCAGCGKRASTAKLVENAKFKHKQKELEQMQQEMEAHG